MLSELSVIALGGDVHLSDEPAEVLEEENVESVEAKADRPLATADGERARAAIAARR